MDNGASSYRRFLAGDENGFVEIVRDYKDGLIFYLRSYVRDYAAAEELAEDTFVKLGLKKPHFSGESAFRTWLYAIARNAALDALRKRAKQTTVPLESCAELADAEEPESGFLREERKILLHQAMQKLRPDYREVLLLLYFADFSNREAAKILHKTTHSTETLAYRARQALKQELMKEGFEDEDL